MARQAVVSRTFESYECVVLCLNPETEEISDVSVTVSARLKDDKAIIKAIAKAGMVGTLVPLHVKSKTTKTVRIAQTEEEFIHYGHEVPLLTKKDAE